jgi:hypothetical protein
MHSVTTQWKSHVHLVTTSIFSGSVDSGEGSVLKGIYDGPLLYTPHPLLVPWTRKGRAIPLFPLWALRPVQSLSACTRGTLPFTFFVVHYIKLRLKLAQVTNFIILKIIKRQNILLIRSKISLIPIL